MKKNFKDDYYLGLDIGTESVGWAVTDTAYKILKFGGNAMWGVRLFDEAQTAAERRTQRSARRRLQRRNNRLLLLQEIFAQEIAKCDPTFFQRLNDSSLLAEDKTDYQFNTLFADPNYTDADYHEEYPTIYHLRSALIEENDVDDIRLIYLALHHILKHRGHFLFEGSLESATDFSNIYSSFISVMNERFECSFSVEEDYVKQLEATLKRRDLRGKRKKEAIVTALGLNKANKQELEVLSLIVGLKGKPSVIFPDDPDAQAMGKESFSFADASYEDKRLELETACPEICEGLDAIKSLYDWDLLTEILNGKANLSDAKVALHEKHQKDLTLLKAVVRQHLPKASYTKIFRSSAQENNYVHYIGHTQAKNIRENVKRCTNDDFYKLLKKELKNVADDDANKILSEIEDGTFLSLQVSGSNGVIPHQLHQRELVQILTLAAKKFPFLNEVDETGLTNQQKIEKIFAFRIPYYVGPLNTHHSQFGGNSWMIRKEGKEGAIRPWNFDEIVNLDASAEAFIRRMTNKCTYLLGEDVLPRHSLLYSEFTVLNELNNLKIKDTPVSAELETKIFEGLFKTKSKVTGKALLSFLKSEGNDLTEEDLSGFDKDFSSSLTSYLDFSKKVFANTPDQMEDEATIKMIEQIIQWICLYGEDKKMLRRIIQREYPDRFTDMQLKAISALRYSGWGRLSHALLEDTYGGPNDGTGVIMTIMEALREGTDNMMQLLSNRYTFTEEIQRKNEERQNIITKVTYDSTVADLYCSPSVKRALWQVVSISQEICKIMGKPPTRIFLEMARGGKEVKKGDAGRTKSRKTRLMELYANIKNESRDWKDELEKTPDDSFRSIKLYLYYTQKGRCMYSGESIALSELANTNIYDRDHIYPQSKTKDDSLTNLVLVRKDINSHKSDNHISPEIQQKMRPFWQELLREGLISQEKFKRLTRTTPLTQDELGGFIQRQLVETRQSSKAAAELFQRLYPESETVYVKSELSSDFRHEHDFVKSRTVNDFHHAKDAYLNIVVGNVYHEKFTSNPAKWLKKNKNAVYSLNQMFKRELIGRNGNLVWSMGKDGTIDTVRKTMAKNNILYTRHSTVTKGGFFKQQPIPGKDKKPGLLVARKDGLDPQKYGGYTGVVPAYFALVESDDKKGKKRTIEAVPLHLVDQFEKDQNAFVEYCQEHYGLINPVVKIRRIMKNSLLVVNGFPMHLRGKTDARLSVQGAVQLCLSENHYSYFKHIEKYIERNAKRVDKKQNLPIRATYDKITAQENLELYDALVQKQINTIYNNRPNNQGEQLIQCRETFANLGIAEQAMVLNEIINLLRCRPIAANLALLNKGQHTGVMLISKNISAFYSVLLVNQSITGLYSQTIDLLRV